MPIHGPDDPVYTISVMARLVGVSTQMLRIWEKEELVCPYRTETNNRLYSEQDFYRLIKIRNLNRQGVNIAGIREILGMITPKEYIPETRNKVRETNYGQSSRD